MGKNKADVLASSHRNTINKKIIKMMEIMSACLFDFSVVVFTVVFFVQQDSLYFAFNQSRIPQLNMKLNVLSIFYVY